MSSKRDDYLRGIAFSAPELRISAINPDRQHIFEAAFNTVRNPNHWKGPINALIEPSDPLKGLYAEAVEFMTGTKPEFFLTNIPAPLGGWYLRLVSEGYALGPCA